MTTGYKWQHMQSHSFTYYRRRSSGGYLFLGSLVSVSFLFRCSNKRRCSMYTSKASFTWTFWGKTHINIQFVLVKNWRAIHQSSKLFYWTAPYKLPISFFSSTIRAGCYTSSSELTSGVSQLNPYWPLHKSSHKLSSFDSNPYFVLFT